MLGLALAAGLGLPDPPRRPRAAHAGLRYVDFPPGRRTDGAGPGIAAARAVPGVVRVHLEVPRGAVVRRPPTGARHHAYVLATASTAGSLGTVLDRATGLLGGRHDAPGVHGVR
ncbi:hypothetical protein ACFWBH_25465 [Streptomyces sp. NPDC059999]|uniref:hypothetical protein n=1 Tax=Streptomyces sp. NPDC059999 TaxID=3347030 RepID=UPI0036B4BA77